MPGLDNSLQNSNELIEPEVAPEEEQPLLDRNTRKRLKIKGDKNLLTLEEDEETIIEQIEKINMNRVLNRIEGKKNYYKRILFQGAFAMFAASATTYALGYYQTEPIFYCK